VRSRHHPKECAPPLPYLGKETGKQLLWSLLPVSRAMLKESEKVLRVGKDSTPPQAPRHPSASGSKEWELTTFRHCPGQREL